MAILEAHLVVKEVLIHAINMATTMPATTTDHNETLLLQINIPLRLGEIHAAAVHLHKCDVLHGKTCTTDAVHHKIPTPKDLPIKTHPCKVNRVRHDLQCRPSI
jgi:hypothetical protein